MVYFISDNHGHIKIGVTQNVDSRIKQMQTGNPYELICLKCLNTRWYRVFGHSKVDDYDLEKMFHYYFRDDVCKTSNSTSEWFYESNILPIIQLSDEDFIQWAKDNLTLKYDAFEIDKLSAKESKGYWESEAKRLNQYNKRLKSQIDNQKKIITELKTKLKQEENK